MRPDSQLFKDAEKKPLLFWWNGPPERARLDEWVAKFDGRVPDDLLSLWQATGGGEIFESETILSPFGDPAMGDDVDGMTRVQQGRGLDPDWVVFHVGTGMSAFNRRDGRIAWFPENSSGFVQTFDSLDDWYVSFLRAEFAERYGM